MSKNKITRFLEISFALILIIGLSANALIQEVIAIQWQKIFQEAREWQVASDDTASRVVTACEINDVSDSTCYNAIVADGGTSDTVATKTEHLDAPFQTLSVSSINSVTLYYDSWGVMDTGEDWWIEVRPTRDGSAICSVNPAPENATENRDSLDCSAITTTQLNNGVWLYIAGNDAKGPNYNNIDYVYLYVDYEPIGNTAPTISNVYLGTNPRGEDGNINLLENSDIEIVVSAQVDDNDTCSDISGAKAYVFISSAAWVYGVDTTGTCSFDYNDCYTPDFDGGVIDCVQQSCSGNTAYYDCTASDSGQGGDGMYYHARATDATASATQAAWWWVAMVIATDSVMNDAYATSANSAPDVILQPAITLNTGSNAIDYGTVNPGNDSSVFERGIENSGNRGIDITIAATAALEIAAGGQGIATGQQQFGLTTFTVGDETSLSETAYELNVDLDKPQTHTAGAWDDQIFWGIYIPVGTAPGTYSGGQTTYTAVSD